MRKFISISVLMLLLSSLSAQGPLLDSTKRHEFGIAVQGLLGGGGGGYGLTYRYHIKNGAIRSGINIGGNSANTNLDDFPGGRQLRRSSFLVSSRLGFEGHIWFTPKWMTYIGGDLLGQYNSSNRTSLIINSTQTIENENISNSARIGIAPLVGVRFQVTPRISLGTELRYITGFVFQKQEVITNPRQPSEVSTKTSTTFFDSFFEKPAAIYLQINL